MASISGGTLLCSPEDLFHFIVQLQGLPHIPGLAVRPEKEDVDAFVIRIMRHQFPSVPGHLGHIPDRHGFLQLLEERIDIDSFQPVALRQVPVLIIRGILDVEPLQETALVQFQIVSRIRLETLHIDAERDFRIDFDDGLPGRDKDVRPQQFLGFVKSVAEILLGHCIGFVPPQDPSELITHHSSLDEDIVHKSVDLVIGEEDFLPVFANDRCAQKTRFKFTRHTVSLTIQMIPRKM